MGGATGSDLIWAALLARWTAFARASLALPRDAEGDRWRRAVPSIVGLQAVAHALGEGPSLARDELALGLDRASLLIDRHEGELRALWSGALHPELESLVGDARRAHELACRVLAGHPST